MTISTVGVRLVCIRCGSTMWIGIDDWVEDWLCPRCSVQEADE